jgi:hypothetical protein
MWFMVYIIRYEGFAGFWPRRRLIDAYFFLLSFCWLIIMQADSSPPLRLDSARPSPPFTHPGVVSAISCSCGWGGCSVWPLLASLLLQPLSPSHQLNSKLCVLLKRRVPWLTRQSPCRTTHNINGLRSRSLSSLYPLPNFRTGLMMDITSRQPNCKHYITSSTTCHLEYKYVCHM